MTRLGQQERPEELVDRCAALAALGTDHAVVLTDRAWTPTTPATLAAARPAVDALRTDRSAPAEPR